MKEKAKTILVALAVVLSLCMIPSAYATPLNLSGFTALDDPEVIESDGTVIFTETFDYAPLYFFNDAFFVNSDATMLSFNYDFTLGEEDELDYLMFAVDYASELVVDATISGGYFEYDLSSFRDQSISLEWSLQWGGDDPAGTTASVYNIALATETAPIPEPTTFILLGMGLFGLAGLGRRRNW